jgi:hypothetical protein
MVLRVVRARRERKDTLTELLKFLRYRYELSERALSHHAKLAADAMVGKLLQLYADALWVDELERRAKGGCRAVQGPRRCQAKRSGRASGEGR